MMPNTLTSERAKRNPGKRCLVGDGLETVNLTGLTLRGFRGRKVSKGRRSIRRRRYSFQPGDIVRYQNELYVSKGIQNLGVYIRLGDLTKPVKTALVKP